ncbi:hypothetical protein FQA39_LY13644 [Lamprigera yunnana]|nr:hypothetical protein FQA39_LY13644 [Lamprigera yunnana]
MNINKQVWCGVFVIILCSSFKLINSQWLIDDDGCRTPYRGIGTCVLIKECQPMIEYLETSQTITPAVVSILRGYQCGFEGNDVKVCCPDGPIVVQRPRNPNVELLANHRNINLLPSDCGVLPGVNRIIGGNRTALFEFPWMALLSYQTPNGIDFRCGGTVINNRYILTAAHCITNLSTLRLLGVRCGEHNITSDVDCEGSNNPELVTCAPPVQDMGIEETIPHPSYNATTYSDDIGLIRMSSPLNTSVDSVKPICLPTVNSLRNLNFTSTRLLVTGWGATETGRRSAELLKVEIAVTSRDNCQRTYENTQAQLTDRQICAGGQNRRDSCGGDSGGPIQRIDSYNDDARYVQYGVVSFGPRFCGQEGFPGVYTRTDSYIEWILDNMKP